MYLPLASKQIIESSKIQNIFTLARAGTSIMSSGRGLTVGNTSSFTVLYPFCGNRLMSGITITIIHRKTISRRLAYKIQAHSYCKENVFRLSFSGTTSELYINLLSNVERWHLAVILIKSNTNTI